jgi:hypothetical protein
MIFVASFKQTGKIPVTIGSKVPECPAIFAFAIIFVHSLTWWLVGPLGLSIMTIPLAKSS